MHNLSCHFFAHYLCPPKEESNADNYYHKRNDTDLKSLVEKYFCNLFLRLYVLLAIREVSSFAHHVIPSYTLRLANRCDPLLVCDNWIDDIRSEQIHFEIL